MCAVFPSRRTTSASQWLGGSVAVTCSGPLTPAIVGGPSPRRSRDQVPGASPGGRGFGPRMGVATPDRCANPRAAGDSCPGSPGLRRASAATVAAAGEDGAMARRTTKQDLPDDFEEHILD